MYNQILKQRIGYFRYMRGKIQRQAREIDLSVSQGLFSKTNTSTILIFNIPLYRA